MSDRAALRATVRGRVQMVGFRWFARHAAERHGVAGWVRNRSNGAVEVEASGPRGALDAFIEDLRQGPPSARVSAVDIDRLAEPPEHHGFEITH